MTFSILNIVPLSKIILKCLYVIYYEKQYLLGSRRDAESLNANSSVLILNMRATGILMTFGSNPGQIAKLALLVFV